MPERNGPPTPTHDPRACNLCSTLRHPGTAAQGRALAAHLAKNPMPRQQKGGRK